MRRIGRLVIAAVLGIATACIGTIHPPAQPAPSSDAYVRAPFDTTWQRVIAFFADARVPIQTIDKASGLLASSRFRLSDEQAIDWADCGTANGESAIVRLKKIGNPPQVMADFNVFVRRAADSTAVRINLGVVTDARAPIGNVPITCVTNGTFEHRLVERLRGQTAPRGP